MMKTSRIENEGMGWRIDGQTEMEYLQEKSFARIRFSIQNITYHVYVIASL